MPLAAVTNGQQTDASQLDQFVNLLTGVMTDQPVTIANAITAKGAAGTAAPTSGAPSPGMIAVVGTENALHAGGAVVFGGLAGTFHAALKSDLNNGGNNSTGDLVVYTRRNATDASLTEAGRWTQGGFLTLNGNPTPGASPGDIVVNRGGTSPGSGVVFFGSSNGAHYLYYDGTRFNFTDLVSASSFTGTLNTAAQPNITSLGTLTSLHVTGTITGDATGATSSTAAIYLSAANPTLLTGSSYLTIPNGLYVSGGTLYATNSIKARGGVDDDTHSTMQLGSNASALVFTKFKARARTTSASASLAANTATKVQLKSADYDPNSNFDITTNYRYTAPVTGYYFISWKYVAYSIAAGTTVIALLYKNGSEIDRGDLSTGSIDSPTAVVSGIYQLNSGDYIEGWGFTQQAAAPWGNTGIYYSSLTVHLVSV